MKINVETHDLWHAVDHDGEVLEVFVTKRRKRQAELKFLRKAMKRYGQTERIVIDRLKSYRASMKKIGNENKQDVERWLNDRPENSHWLLRRRERAMLEFSRMPSLQKFASDHSSVYNHFNLERHFYRRAEFKEDQSAALAEWRQLAA